MQTASLESTNVYAYVPFVCFLLTSLVTTYFHAKAQPGKVKRTYLLFSISLSMWIFLDLLLWLRINPDWYMPMLKIQSLFWIPVGSLFLNFTYAYLGLPQSRRNTIFQVLAIIAMIISVTTNLVEMGYYVVPWGILHRSGPLYGTVSAVTTLPMLLGVYLLWQRYRSSTDLLEKKPLLLLISGAITGSVITVITIVFIPEVLGRHDILPLHDVGILIHSIFTSIAVSKYRFLNVQVADVADELFSSLQDGVVILDRNGYIKHANTASMTLLRLDNSSINQTRFSKLFTEYPTNDRFNTVEVQPCNSSFIYAVTQAPIFSSQGESSRMVILRDITEQKYAERQILEMNTELAKARDQALDASKLKSQFLANMSHELRTPLNAIIGYSEMLEETAKEEERIDIAEDARRIYSSGHHLLTLINDILDISKIEAGRMEAYIEEFDINMLLDNIVTTATPLVNKNHNTFNLDIDEEMGTMHSDVVKIRQVLLNLLSNAAKFTEHGVITLSVRKLIGEDKDFIEFAVADTGIGMTADQVDKLYIPFMQADALTTRKYGGTGLGMSITWHFVNILGGGITANSTFGSGSVFTVRLPFQIKSSDKP